MLAILIKHYREHLGLSLRQMAKRIGVDHCTLYNFEKGKPMTSKNLSAIWRWLLSDK